MKKRPVLFFIPSCLSYKEPLDTPLKNKINFQDKAKVWQIIAIASARFLFFLFQKLQKYFRFQYLEIPRAEENVWGSE